MRKFRVLFIDDEVFKRPVTRADIQNCGMASPLSLVKTLVQVATQNDLTDSLEVYGSAGMRSIEIPYAGQLREKIETVYCIGEATWKPEFFNELDCLILDLGEVDYPEKYQPTLKEWPEVPDEQVLLRVIKRYPGICLLVKNRNQIDGISVTYILTAHDVEGMQSTSDKYDHFAMARRSKREGSLVRHFKR